MRILRFFQEKKYWLRIFFWVASVILLIVSTFSAMIYYNVERKVFQSEYENSKKILSQMKYNIDFMDSTIRNLTISIYGNNEVKALMYLKEDETYEHLSTINKLNDTIIANNPFLHSIYIYNNHKDLYYSTYGDVFHKDEELDQTVRSFDHIPALKAIVRKMRVSVNDPKTMTVLSYIMYENIDEQKRMDGAVILNIKLDWLVNNIRTLNGSDSDELSYLYILDSDHHLIETEQRNTDSTNSFAEKIREAYMRSEAGQAVRAVSTPGFLTESIRGEKYFLSYIHLKNTGWTLIEAKPFNEAYANLKQLLDTILLITATVFIGALFLILTVTRGIYSPVRRLMEQTTMVDGANDRSIHSAARDEFAYLTDVYRKSKEQLYEFQLERNNNLKIMKLYFLKKMLVDSFGMSVSETDNVFKQLGANFSKEHPFLVCVLRIDDYKMFMRKSLAERELLRFAISNVITEVLSKSYAALAVDMKDDMFTVLLGAGEMSDPEKRAVKLLTESQVSIFNATMDAPSLRQSAPLLRTIGGLPLPTVRRWPTSRTGTFSD